MNYAIIMTINGGEEQALLKTTYRDRAVALAGLCELHILKVFPHDDIKVSLSSNLGRNMAADMHPDRDWIIHKLREHEFPLPDKSIQIEGVKYERL